MTTRLLVSAATVLALLALGVWFGAFAAESSAEEVQQRSSVGDSHPVVRSVYSASSREPARRSAGVASVAAAAIGEVEAGGGVGSIEGAVFDRWRVLPHKRVMFSTDAFGVGEVRRSKTDAEGRYTFERVAPGVWHGFLLEDDERLPPLQTIARYMGEVVVEADRRTRFDLHLVGARTLSGNLGLDFSDPEFAVGEGGVGLALELRSEQEPEAVFARGMLVIGTSPWWGEADDASVDATEEQDDHVSAFEMGTFSFSGLEAQRYNLRAYLSVGDDVYIERPVSLVDGDVALTREVLRFDDFVEETIKRRRSR